MKSQRLKFRRLKENAKAFGDHIKEPSFVKKSEISDIRHEKRYLFEKERGDRPSTKKQSRTQNEKSI